MEHKQNFTMTYCAQQKKEVEEIRKKYLPQEANKMDQLRKMHAIPTQKAQTASLILGVLGTLILGLGMSLAMTDLGISLGWLAMVAGIVLGVAGMVLVALAYPTYNQVLRKQRAKIAPEILRLSEELLK